MSERTTNRELQILRGLAIVVVVGFHTTYFQFLSASLDGAPGRTVALVHLLTGFGIPLLVVLSSLGLALRHGPPTRWYDDLGLIGRSALRLLPAYLAWSLLSVALLDPRLFQSPREMFWMLVNGDADEQFYLVPLLIMLRLAWPLVRPLAVWSSSGGPAVCALLGAGAVVSVGWWKLASRGVLPSITAFDLPAWSFCVALGIVAASRAATIRSMAERPLAATVAVAGAGLTGWYMYRSFIALVEPDYLPSAVWSASSVLQIPSALYAVSAMAAAYCVLASVSNHRWAAVLEAFGGHSYGIYLVHVLLLRLVVHPLLPPVHVHGASFPAALGVVAVSWGGCLAASLFLVWLLARWKVTRPLVTNSR